MSAAKNVYALLLALVIVLSGCFGNTSDGVDADDDVGGDDDDIEMIAIGGIAAFPGGYTALGFGVTINTTAGQMLQVHQADNKEGSLGIYTNCTTGEGFYMGDIDATSIYQFRPLYVSGSFTDCTHELVIRMPNGGAADDHSWSFVYSIVPVTVG